MRLLLRQKLMLSFLVVVLVSGFIATVVGVYLIGDGIVGQAQSKVRSDLNSAWEIYNHRLSDITHSLSYTAIRESIKDELMSADRVPLLQTLEKVREQGGLDVLTITDAGGRVVLRTRNPEVYGDSQHEDEIVGKVLREKRPLSGTTMVSEDELRKEGAKLAQRAHIRIRYTRKAEPARKTEEIAGMMLKAAVPIWNGVGDLIGVLYGGDLLNQNYELVDRIKDTVY